MDNMQMGRRHLTQDRLVDMSHERQRGPLPARIKGVLMRAGKACAHDEECRWTEGADGKDRQDLETNVIACKVP